MTWEERMAERAAERRLVREVTAHLERPFLPPQPTPPWMVCTEDFDVTDGTWTEIF